MTVHALPSPATNADCVLGAMLLAPRMIDDICEIIHGEDFRDQRDEIVFNAIVAMQASGTPVDAVTVTDHLRATGDLERIGGPARLHAAITATPSAANGPWYAQRIRDEGRARHSRGASLGGARPKANFTETDGSLWIGKFPARDDDRDVGAWEYVAHTLARKAGVDVPPAKLIRLNNDFHTFCIQRFDRVQGTRRFYASAMTLLRKEHSEGTSYLDLAQFLRAQGDAAHADADLAQLFGGQA